MVKIFSVEKLFTVDCVNNRRNVQKGDSAPPVYHTKHPQSIMMLCVVASNDEKCPPTYINEKEKVTTGLYQPFEKACGIMAQEDLPR